MADDRIALHELLEKGSMPTRCAKMLGFAAERLMDLEVKGPTGAGTASARRCDAGVIRQPQAFLDKRNGTRPFSPGTGRPRMRPGTPSGGRLSSGQARRRRGHCPTGSPANAEPASMPPASSERSEPLLRVEGVSRHFGPMVALDQVSFEVRPGEVLGLLGDNGAGKSTLVKILSGSLAPSSGRLWLDGRPVAFGDPADAKALGIETVYQDLSLCENVDVVANFFMGRELYRSVLGFRFLRERAMESETERALAGIGTHIPSVRTTVEHLSGGQRQAIELCRFVHWGGRLVLLDEPFAALGVQQTRRGLELIEQIRQRGVAIVVITHNLLHAFQVADRIIVLRHGHVSGERVVHSTSPEEIVSLITGGLSDPAPAA